MKASELIKKLEANLEVSGDLEITCDFRAPQIEVIPAPVGEEETLNIYGVEA